MDGHATFELSPSEINKKKKNNNKTEDDFNFPILWYVLLRLTAAT